MPFQHVEEWDVGLFDRLLEHVLELPERLVAMDGEYQLHGEAPRSPFTLVAVGPGIDTSLPCGTPWVECHFFFRRTAPGTSYRKDAHWR